MKFKFEKLIIWQKAMDFGEEITYKEKEFSINYDDSYNLMNMIIAFKKNIK